MAGASKQKLLAEWFWVDRWTGSTAFALPLEVRGLYREMLSQAWRRGARLPNDPEAIRRIVGATEREWRRLWPQVQGYWRIDGDSLVNDTQLEIYAEAQAQVAKFQDRARGAAQARWGRGGGPAQAVLKHPTSNAQAYAQASAQAVLEQCPPSPSPVPSVPEVRTLERVPPQEPRRRRPDSLVGKGEVLRFDEEQQRLHARCHREVCTYWTTEPTVRLCLTASQVAQFAGKLVSLPEAERVPTVVRWAQSHVPTVAELPANLFRYWDEQWDLRPAAKPKRSAVWSPEETLAKMRRDEEMAGR